MFDIVDEPFPGEIMNPKPWQPPLAAVVLCFLALSVPAADTTLTFYGWSDQHVTTEGKADHLLPAIDAMNTLAGTPYPDNISGKVDPPAFVFGCGDISEWPTNAAKDAYNDALTKRLKIPAYDIIGNHDEGGKSPSQTVKNWIIQRHRSLSYTFDQSGVRFIAVFSPYDETLDNPAQAIHKDALAFIRDQLAKTPKPQPVVIAFHQCLDSITNRDELVAAFKGANVILVLGGHYHKATVGEYGGFRFLQLPSPQSTTQFTVIRITPTRLTAIPYDYKTKKWIDDSKVILDTPLPQITNNK
jgi:hypothetical protein